MIASRSQVRVPDPWPGQGGGRLRRVAPGMGGCRELCHRCGIRAALWGHLQHLAVTRSLTLHGLELFVYASESFVFQSLARRAGSNPSCGR